MSDPTVFGEKATEQIAKTVREVARRMMNEPQRRARWQHHPSGGGNKIIRFQIHVADCDNRSAVVKILSSDRTAVEGSYTITGEVETNEAGASVDSKFVVVYDKTGGKLNESNRNLLNRFGYATYLYGRPLHTYDPWWAWEVTGLEEQQTECEAF